MGESFNVYSGLSDERLIQVASNWAAEKVPAERGLVGVPSALLEELIRRLEEQG